MSPLLSRPFLQFHAACETGSLKEAAEKIGVTQAAISRGLKSLEDQLKIALFERDGHRLHPTEAGLVLNRFAAKVAEDIRRFDLEIASLQENRQGAMHIGVGPIWSRNPVPAIIGQLRREYPRVRVEVTTAIAPALKDDFLAKKIDILIGEISDLPSDRALKTLPLWKTDRRVWVRAGHPLLSRDPLELKDLSDFPWVGQEQDKNLRLRIADHFRNEGNQPPKIEVEASSLEFTLALLASTDMLGMLADSMQLDAKRHGLHQLSVEFPDFSLQSGAVFHSEIEEIRPIRRLIALLGATV